MKNAQPSRSSASIEGLSVRGAGDGSFTRSRRAAAAR
jgi:hypothetical protein